VGGVESRQRSTRPQPDATSANLWKGRQVLRHSQLEIECADQSVIVEACPNCPVVITHIVPPRANPSQSLVVAPFQTAQRVSLPSRRTAKNSGARTPPSAVDALATEARPSVLCTLFVSLPFSVNPLDYRPPPPPPPFPPPPPPPPPFLRFLTPMARQQRFPGGAVC